MDVMVVVVSGASLSSEWVKRECQQVLNANKRLVPYIVDRNVHVRGGDALPNWLTSIQYIDGTSDTGVRELVHQLGPLLN
jgi:hypothetical protein